MRLRRIAVRIVWIFIFLILAVVIITPLIAELEFNSAKRLESSSFLEEAYQRYQLAARLNPFNSSYLAGLGDLLVRKSAGLRGLVRMYWLEKAEELYENALKLNPRNAEYVLNLGQARLRLYLFDVKNQDNKKRIFDNFKSALKNDPNGFNISYSVGYAGLAIWDFLDKNEKELVLDRLRYAVKLHPSYGKYIYPSLWLHTKDFELLKRITPDNLESNRSLYSFVLDNGIKQFIGEQKRMVDLYRQREEPEILKREKIEKMKRIGRIKNAGMKAANSVSVSSWRGKDASDKMVYENGCMYWSGTMDAVVRVPAGEATVKIQAMGSPGNGVYPFMIVELDGKEIGETFIDSSEWREYDFKINTEGGVKVLSVTFANDYCTEKEDRNLYVGEARVE